MTRTLKEFDTEERYRLKALWKQATKGECLADPPDFGSKDYKHKYAKWNAWKQLGSKSSGTAMAKHNALFGLEFSQTKSHRNEADAHYSKALKHLNNFRIRETISACTKALDVFPFHIDSKALVLNLYMRLGRCLTANSQFWNFEGVKVVESVLEKMKVVSTHMDNCIDAKKVVDGRCR